jgi:hypothetical protein
MPWRTTFLVSSGRAFYSVQLTDIKTDQIFRFEFSRDGKQFTRLGQSRYLAVNT